MLGIWPEGELNRVFFSIPNVDICVFNHLFVCVQLYMYWRSSCDATNEETCPIITFPINIILHSGQVLSHPSSFSWGVPPMFLVRV